MFRPTRHEDSDAPDLAARDAAPKTSWNFSASPIFPPHRANQAEPPSPLKAPRLPGVPQAKLAIGSVDDPLEHEADRVAEQVMRMPAPEVEPTLSLKNTLAMLKQKRDSFLRGITLNYQEPMPRITAPSDDAAAFAELAKARGDAKSAHQEAAMYSGGLIQTMALVREVTAKTTEAAIEQRIALAKLGIPLPSLSGTNAPVPKSPGKTTSDRDALQ
jgi:hypothetical protein